MRIDVNSVDAAGDDVGVTRGQRKPASEAVRVAAKLTADCHDDPINWTILTAVLSNILKTVVQCLHSCNTCSIEGSIGQVSYHKNTSIKHRALSGGCLLCASGCGPTTNLQRTL